MTEQSEQKKNDHKIKRVGKLLTVSYTQLDYYLLSIIVKWMTTSIQSTRTKLFYQNELLFTF